MTRIERMEACIRAQCPVAFLEIINESHQHRPRPEAETHLKIILVSKDFEGLTRLARHQALHQWLGEEFQHGLHALTLAVYTPDEWAHRSRAVLASPACQRSRRSK